MPEARKLDGERRVFVTVERDDGPLRARPDVELQSFRFSEVEDILFQLFMSMKFEPTYASEMNPLRTKVQTCAHQKWAQIRTKNGPTC